MKKQLIAIICPLLFLFNLTKSGAQESTQSNSSIFGNHKIITVGGAQIDYINDSTQSTFANAKFSLLTLAQMSSKLFLISELEVETSDNETAIGLEQAQLCYNLAPGITIYAGRFLPKFGKFRGMLGEGMLNRFPTNPVGYGDGGIGPMVETGIGIVGGFQLGYSKLNYDIYISNGPQLLTGPDADGNIVDGQFEYEAYYDNNKSKAIGGRIGFLPLSNSCLEIGLSGLKAANTANSGTHLDSIGVGATWYAIDANYSHYFDELKSRFLLTGEYKGANVNKVDYLAEGDSTTYTFDNTSNAYYVQASIRPSGAKNKILNKLEIAARYSEYNPAKDAFWGGSKITQRTIGINFWLAWDCVLKLSYQTQSNDITKYLGQLVFRF